MLTQGRCAFWRSQDIAWTYHAVRQLQIAQMPRSCAEQQLSAGAHSPAGEQSGTEGILIFGRELSRQLCRSHRTHGGWISLPLTGTRDHPARVELGAITPASSTERP